MANFEQAYDITLSHEGGYSDNPDDRGGETIFGISRVAHPTWPGWDIIDGLNECSDCDPNRFDDNEELKELAQLLYRNEYWDRIKGSQLPDQRLANILFDSAVNMGWRTAGKFLQHALNVFNRNQKLYKDIVVDGWVGPVTLKMLDKFLETDKIDLLISDIVIQIGARFHNILLKDPTQETFARGWIKRVTIKFERHAG